MKKLAFLGCLLIAVFTSGCATDLKANVAPGATFDNLGQTFVARFEPDKRNLNKVIADELTTLGYPASAGEKDEMPAGTDTLVTYVDKWMWDMSNYLLRITINLKDARTEELIVSGESYRTSMARKSPEFMINETLTEILKEKA